MFAKAVELDPLYARAYAGMADCDSFLYVITTASKSPPTVILAIADKALSLDETLPEAACLARVCILACKAARGSRSRI